MSDKPDATFRNVWKNTLDPENHKSCSRRSATIRHDWKHQEAAPPTGTTNSGCGHCPETGKQNEEK